MFERRARVRSRSEEPQTALSFICALVTAVESGMSSEEPPLARQDEGGHFPKAPVRSVRNVKAEGWRLGNTIPNVPSRNSSGHFHRPGAGERADGQVAPQSGENDREV